MPAHEQLRDICLALQEREEAIYLVGGYVRDWLLGQESHDLDFAVDGPAIPLARHIANAFHGYFVLLDEEHDTARTIFRTRGEEYSVDFAGLRGGDIRSDLAARDFAINAIAINVRDLEAKPPPLIDPLHGQQDIAAHLIRATSPQAFRDDPLRMLRAVRQAARLSFRITPDTEALIQRDAPLIVQVSHERVRDEIAQLFACPGIAGNLRYLNRLGLLAQLLPELSPLHDIAYPSGCTAYDHAIHTADAAEKILSMAIGTPVEIEAPFPDSFCAALLPYQARFRAHWGEVLSDVRDRGTLLVIAALLHNLGDKEGTSDDLSEEISQNSAEIAASVLQRLRFSNREVGLAGTVIRGHRRLGQLANQERLDRRDRYRFFRQFGEAGLDILFLSLAVGWAAGWPQRAGARWQRQLEVSAELVHYYYQIWPAITSLPPLMDGRELMKRFHLRPGPLIGKLLEAMQEAYAIGEISSREEAISWAERWLGK